MDDDGTDGQQPFRRAVRSIIATVTRTTVRTRALTSRISRKGLTLGHGRAIFVWRYKMTSNKREHHIVDVYDDCPCSGANLSRLLQPASVITTVKDFDSVPASTIPRESR